MGRCVSERFLRFETKLSLTGLLEPVAVGEAVLDEVSFRATLELLLCVEVRIADVLGRNQELLKLRHTFLLKPIVSARDSVASQ